MTIEQNRGQSRQRLRAADVWTPAISDSSDQKSPDSKHSYELYANSAASRGINDYAISKISSRRSRVIDVGTGTGATISGLIDGGKLSEDFRLVGIDIDRPGLKKTIAKVANYNGVDYSANIKVVLSSGEMLPIQDNWADLLVSLNTMHLFDDPKNFFSGASRALGSGGELITNSTYEKDSTYADPKSRRAVILMLLEARRFAHEHGFDAGPPIDPARFNREEWKQMAEDAGFIDTRTEMKTVHMTPDDMEAIFSSEEFSLGALPLVPYEIAAEGLVRSVKPIFEKMKIETVNRNWLVLTARKPKINRRPLQLPRFPDAMS